MSDRPSTPLDHWRDLRAHTWNRLIWSLMTRFAALLQWVSRTLEWIRPLPPPSMPEHHNTLSSAQSVRDGDRVQTSFKFPAREPINLGDPIFLSSDDNVRMIGSALDDKTILFRPDGMRLKPTTHYRDEDGELRPTRFDRSPLADSSIEDVAAEFLHAKADAENAPDPLEREIIAALRDAYGREIWRRISTGAVREIMVGGKRYFIHAVSDCVNLTEMD